MAGHDEIGEGSLEWIQVLPEYRGQGLGTKLVLELLCRLKDKAAFVTVCGEVDNPIRSFKNEEAHQRKREAGCCHKHTAQTQSTASPQRKDL